MLGRFRYQRWLILLAYLLAALYLTAPIQGAISSRLLGGEAGDAYEMARHIWWFKTALHSGERVFDHSLLGYPEGFAAAGLWAHPLQFFPMWLFAFVLPLAAAYNLGLMLWLILNGWTMYLLARRRLPTGALFPSFLAGLVFMILPTMQAHLFAGQPGLLMLWPLPLCIICLFDYADYGGTGRYLRALLFFFLAALGDSLQLIYILGPFALLFLGARLYRRDYVGALRLVAVAAVGCLLLLLFLAPVFGDMLGEAAQNRGGNIVRDSIDLLSLVTPAQGHPLRAGTSAAVETSSTPFLVAGAGYIGLAGGLLALVGLLYRRRARWWLAVALTAWLLALGPVLKLSGQVLTASISGYEAVLPLPLAFVINLPIIELAQSPSRFMLLFAPAFALLVGFGASALWSSRAVRRHHRYVQFALAFLLSLLLIQDYRLFGDFPSLSAELPEAIHVLERRRDIRAVYNVPYDDIAVAGEAMYLQTAHGKPIIAGHDAGAPSAVDPARLELLQRLEPALLLDAGADIVIIHKAQFADSAQLELLQWRARNLLGEPFYEDRRFALYETPFTSSPPAAMHSVKAEPEAHTTYLYKEQPGWLEYRATLEAVNRRVHLTLDDRPLETLDVNGQIPISIALPIAARGYHSFRIAQDPPCPERMDATLLQCQRVTVDDVEIRVLSSGALYDPIRIADGIVLAGYHLPRTSDLDDEVPIRLWWQFEANRSANDVRFVHVLDAGGLPVPERPPDHSFGLIAAGTELTETIRLETSRLAPGEYRVLTGWYALPDAIRYDVLTSVAGAQDDTVVLGTIRVSD